MEIPVPSLTLVCNFSVSCVSQSNLFINHNTFLKCGIFYFVYVVTSGFPLWVRGCMFAETPSGQTYLGCHKIHNQTMEMQGCMCQENGCNKELKEPSGIFKSSFAYQLTHDKMHIFSNNHFFIF